MTRTSAVMARRMTRGRAATLLRCLLPALDFKGRWAPCGVCEGCPHLAAAVPGSRAAMLVELGRRIAREDRASGKG